MLEKTLTAWSSSFAGEHFISDAHSLIYGAIIIDLFKASSDPVDMRTVVSQLRKTKARTGGPGLNAIAELTSR